MIEGVDFSTTSDADWDRLAAAIKAAGKTFVVVYAVSDKAPNGRGATDAMYQAFTRVGLKVAFYWEGSASWMLGGFQAGVNAANNFVANLASIGAPADTAGIFAHDIDPDPADFPVIDACLRGIASVIGWERTGVYGGWLLIDYLAGGGTVKILVQTRAWEYGRGVHPAAVAYQYGFNAFIDNVNMDLVQAYPDYFGQAGYVAPVPVPTPKPENVYPSAELPDWWADALKQSHPSDADVEIDGQTVRMHAVRRRVQAIGNTFRYTRPNIKSPRSGDPIKVKDKVNIERVFDLKGKNAKGETVTKTWFITDTGDYVFAGKFDPKVTVRTR